MKFGDTNPEEVHSAQESVKAYRKNVPQDVPIHEIAVAVYINGQLVYHGGAGIGCNRLPERPAVKQMALSVLANGMADVEWSEEERKALIEDGLCSSGAQN